MSRNTSRRATGIGVGALAALVLAAPSAVADTGTVVLEPLEGTVVGDVSAYSVTEGEDFFSISDTVSVPASGEVGIELASGLAAVDGEVTAGLVDQEAYDRFTFGEDSDLPDAFLDDLDVEVVDDGAVTTVGVTVPLEDPSLAEVDEVYLVVDGVEVELLGETTPFVVALDLFPAGEDDPAVVQTDLTFYGELPDPLELRAGEAFTATLPEADGLLPGAGIETLDDLAVLLFPLDDLEELGVEPGDVLGAEELTGLAEAGAATDAGAGAALTALATGDRRSVVEDEDEGEAFDGLPLVQGDGRSATVTLAEEQEAGSYGVLFIAYGDETSVVLSAEAEVAAAAVEPEPAPEPTETAAPAPTPTVTVTAPPRQNPGLRSNTGVETAAVPGLSDGQLAGLGGGLLALGTVAGVAVVRTQRRSRA